ncbi:hypothetical protein N7475_005161 [Penicillium sp. IBT 31633x]|nr:hypothetical protein N7475_005161 [Penicillium sp. IBT 31633x]
MAQEGLIRTNISKVRHATSGRSTPSHLYRLSITTEETYILENVSALCSTRLYQYLFLDSDNDIAVSILTHEDLFIAAARCRCDE